jgi:hypothetical protein
LSAAVTILSLGSVLQEKTAYAMGSTPGSCTNEYNYSLKSMTANNGIYTFDLLANQYKGFSFNGNNSRGYEITFTIHTANQNRSGNAQNGSIWYRTDSQGYGNGVCITGIKPNQEKTVIVKGIVPLQKINNTSLGNGDPNNVEAVEWDFSYFNQKVTYLVNWYTNSFSTDDISSSYVPGAKIEMPNHNDIKSVDYSK